MLLDVLDNFDRTATAISKSHTIQVPDQAAICFQRVFRMSASLRRRTRLSTMTGIPPGYRISPVTICAGFRISLGPLEYPSQVTRRTDIGVDGVAAPHGGHD
jgi:hypothetical protein